MQPTVGKYIMLVGEAIVLIGLIVYLAGDKLRWLGQWLGRLPGDIRMEGPNGGFYFPVVTCILLSLVLNLVIWLIRRFLS